MNLSEHKNFEKLKPQQKCIIVQYCTLYCCYNDDFSFNENEMHLKHTHTCIYTMYIVEVYSLSLFHFIYFYFRVGKKVTKYEG